MFYQPHAVAIFDDYHPFGEFRQIAAKYPFRFIFAPNRNTYIDTKYIPLHYDRCSLIRSLVQEYEMTDEQIANYLNFLGIKPEHPLKAKQFN